MSARLFCTDACADGYESDREHGLIYGLVSVDGELATWDEAMTQLGCCHYCGAEVSDAARAMAA